MNKRYLIPLIFLVVMLAAYINTEVNFTYTWGQWIFKSLTIIFLWYCGYKANE
ncbi:MAG: hypothetical protein ACOCRK_11405 [bacterium]